MVLPFSHQSSPYPALSGGVPRHDEANHALSARMGTPFHRPRLSANRPKRAMSRAVLLRIHPGSPVSTLGIREEPDIPMRSNSRRREREIGRQRTRIT